MSAVQSEGSFLTNPSVYCIFGSGASSEAAFHSAVPVITPPLDVSQSADHP